MNEFSIDIIDVRACVTVYFIICVFVLAACQVLKLFWFKMKLLFARICSSVPYSASSPLCKRNT